MKDRASWAWLLLCGLPLGAAGQILQFGGPTTAAELMPEPRGDLLEFVDGSALHGQLEGMDLQHGLTWEKPEVRNRMLFRPTHIDLIRLARAQSVSITPTCHLWFGDGDDLYGAITSLDDQRLGFSTWFGGSMAIPREAVRAITFLSPHYSVVYEGPYDEGGWMVVNSAPRSWTFHDGAFIGTGRGMLGRELHLTNSTTVEFDLAWSGPFALETGIYCDVTDRQEAGSGSCLVDLTARQVSLRQTQNMGIPFGMAGVPLPEGGGKDRMRVAIECDKAEETASVFVNHLLVKVWKNCSFQGGGTGILFMQQNMWGASATLKLSHLKISQWESRSEPETSAPAGATDAIQFVNHDRAAGKIESIQNGKARLALAGTVLDIPLARVTRMEFAAAKAPAEASNPWRVRAHFPGGGSLSFQLEKWDDKGVLGQSALFGSLAFQPGAIRELEFNLNRPKEDAVAAGDKEFEEFDE
jgi:hypothetical protein